MSKRDTGDILREAQAKIANYATWLSHGDTVDAEGRIVADDDPSAARWCAMAALMSLPDGLEAEQSLTEAAEDELEIAGYDTDAVDEHGDFLIPVPIEYLNDELGHIAALTMYDRAIAWHTPKGGQR